MNTPMPILTRGCKLEIDIGAGYVEIKGLESMSFERSSKASEWTLKEDMGQENGVIATRGKSIKCKGKYLVDATDGTRDPGQAAVETAAGYIDYQSRVKTRLTLPPDGSASAEQVEFYATYEMDTVGGDFNEAMDWGFTATRRGTDI